MGSCLSGESGNSLPVSPHLSSPGSRRRRRSSKKRSRSQSSSFSFQKDELLHSIPGRMFLNGSSEVASLFSQQGKKGVNQDAMIVWENFGSRKDTVFCGVFDGHGPYGHLVSKRVRDLLPLKLSSHMEGYVSHEDVLREINPNTADKMNSENTAFISANEDSRASIVLKNEENYPDIFQTLKGSFLKAFKLMDKDLKMQGNIDCLCSGTTAVTLIKQGRHLVIGNVGDSRAVLATRSEDNILSAVQLTVDLKPNVPAEAERILKRKGRVFALQDEPEVARVWLPHLDAPGLAMARAFGDFCLKDFGLISVPELSYRCLTEKDEFIVLATDGIWDVLSNEEVVEIIASTPRRASAARALVDSAVRGWRRKFPTSKVDDCAVVCLFLDSKSDHLSTASNTKPKGQKDNMMAEQGDARMSKAIMLEESETDILLPSEMGGRWCALEGVARVNTLVNLPRFPPVKEEKASRGKGACK